MPVWGAQMAGRVVAGVGGVIINVLMTRMVTDWFDGRNLSTAMAIFVNSWPVGIGAGLLILPLLAGSLGLQATYLIVCGVIAVGLVLLVTTYRPPAPAAAPTGARSSSPLRGAALGGLLVAASIWALYNAALGMVFGFGPALLVEQGWPPARASSIVSVVLWAVAVAIPIGGLMADRLKRRNTVLTVGLLGFALVLRVTPAAEQTVLLYAALGAAAGLAAGPIMSLPAAMLQPGNAAFGMGLFWTVHYFALVLAPAVAGRMSEMAETAAVTFSFGAGMLALCLPLLGLFVVLSRRGGHPYPKA